jgi:hypothetical protein
LTTRSAAIYYFMILDLLMVRHISISPDINTQFGKSTSQNGSAPTLE